MNIARIYGLSALTTLVVWAGIAATLGLDAAIVVAALTALEWTFSFDNATLNAPLIARLSPMWERLFLTVGVAIAVFGVRFTVPTLIVAATAGLSVPAVVDLQLHHGAQYAAHLIDAGPILRSFGGTFLLMIGIGFFVDDSKQTHWIGWIERRLARLGAAGDPSVLAMIVAAIVMFFTVPTGPGHTVDRGAVCVAAICAIALHAALALFTAAAEPADEGAAGSSARPRMLFGAAAAIMFARLEVLDASLSFDGIIGAFAITFSIVLILAGLGAGAVWVRSMTVHLVRAGTLAKLRYLEHGAHWAILSLGAVMLAELYGFDPPDWATACIGLVFIAAALASSIAEQRRDQWHEHQRPLSTTRN